MSTSPASSRASDSDQPESPSSRSLAIAGSAAIETLDRDEADPLLSGAEIALGVLELHLDDPQARADALLLASR